MTANLVTFGDGSANLHSRLRTWRWFATVLVVAVFSVNLRPDVVYVTARGQPSGSVNTDGTYAEIGYTADDTSAKSMAIGVPTRSGSRYFSTGFTQKGAYVEIAPTLAVAG